ncbi:type 2 lanthipeptide synthetase LanM [Streptomyces palmae]|uniref:type 2 lanthipeptide synthetase LanM n=1 Tax=Streptomyces palmae TaxID=1701085 RepID=UPI001FD7F9C0|nr:type 2 lanthipeptide synthetase LanM [Streptomyces palmae]
MAYKPRPAAGEALFLAESSPDAPQSVFQLLNTLPPASGPVQLPLLRHRSGRGRDRHAYSWQEWIEPPRQWGTIRRSPRLRLLGTRLGPREATRFWHRAGSLTAACFGFGIADLGEGNVLAGTRPGASAPLLYPVDLEIFLSPMRRLHETGLITAPDGTGHHHPGLEKTARWCTVDGPAAYFTTDRDGGLRLRARRTPCARPDTRNVVADTCGRTGYGPYLPAFLRGMFDAWTLMCRNRKRLNEAVADRATRRFVRVLPHPTAVYTDVLDGELLTGKPGHDAFTLAEREQLDRGDVPYFFRATSGGPLLAMEPPPRASGFAAVADPAPAGTGDTPPAQDTLRLDLAGLGIALRDAVEYVFDDLEPGDFNDPAQGTRIQLTSACEGQVTFDWRQVGRRITYSWDRTTVRLRIDPFRVTPRDPAIGRRLIRLDRVDAVLRERWTAGEFTDTGTEERLRKLTDAGLAWLVDVIHEHGWPGHMLVGRRAAEAACRLVQHAEGPPDVLRACLARMEQAAADGDIPWRHVACTTDAIRLVEGRPQLYGTKFRRGAGGLEPCPIERPEEVDERRRRLGMEPLARYAVRLRHRFPETTAEDA